jgi:hypothetical protein
MSSLCFYAHYKKDKNLDPQNDDNNGMKSLANKFDLNSPSSAQQIFNGFIY